MVRIIRMRRALRGFKDVDANEILTYAGTSSRLSLKLLVSGAVNNGWPVLALDVKKAFLKCVSWKELSVATGERERDINFELNADANAILKTLLCYSTAIKQRKCARSLQEGVKKSCQESGDSAQP